MLIRAYYRDERRLFAGCKARGVVPSEEARRLIVAQVLEQWGVDPKTQKPAFGALRRYAGDVSSCSSWWSRKTTCATTTTTTSAKEKEKDASFIALYNRQVNACLFFCLVILSSYTKCQKRQFCLGSITKCHVTRSGGGLQSRARNKSPIWKLRLADFSIMGQWSCWSFVFWLLGTSANYPKRFAKGWMEYATPALQVVIVPYLLGSTRELGAVWIVPSGSRCGILGYCPC